MLTLISLCCGVVRYFFVQLSQDEPGGRAYAVPLVSHRDGTLTGCSGGGGVAFGDGNTAAGGVSHAFYKTVFSDEASRHVTGVDGQPMSPFTGHYRPEGSLSEFKGMPVKGRWVGNVPCELVLTVGRTTTMIRQCDTMRNYAI